MSEVAHGFLEDFAGSGGVSHGSQQGGVSAETEAARVSFSGRITEELTADKVAVLGETLGEMKGDKSGVPEEATDVLAETTSVSSLSLNSSCWLL